MRRIYAVLLIVPVAVTAIGVGYKSAYASSSLSTVNTKDMGSAPAIIEADTIDYDFTRSLVTATGNVEITQGKRMLIADAVTYDKVKNTVVAKGHVSMMEPSGAVIFADSVNLSDYMKKGVIDNFSARFADNSVMAAKTGERVSENKLIIRNAVYSPCPLCKEKPDKAPLWQVSAQQTTIDNEQQRVSYKNAFFDVYGVPVIYTPYFSHPTPDADRKSGFLVPKYSNDHVFGTVAKIPYYWDIAPDKDATITSTITTKEGIVLSGEFRAITENGHIRLAGSATDADKEDASGNQIPGHDVRSHIEGDGEFAINDLWNWGFNAKRASDDTYLKKYSFGDEDTLTSNLYTDRIENRDHILLNAISFQGLNQTDDPAKTPLVLPYEESHTERKITDFNTVAFADTNVMALTRSVGVSSKRISVKGGLTQPMVTQSGSVLEGSVSIRQDAYFVDNVIVDPTTGGTTDGNENRTIPEASLKWSLPMVKYTPQRQYVIEPVTNFVISPNGGNSIKIPNEDSQDIEFSDDNLFDNNHFTGYDRVETGARVNYGMRGSANDYKLGNVNFLFGQSYRPHRDTDFTPQSGLYDNFSDYVGKISYNKGDFFDAAYKFRYDKDSFAVRNNSVSASVNKAPLHFSLDYVAIEDNASTATTANGTPTVLDPLNTTATGDNREVIIASTKLDLNEKWQIEADGNRNLATSQWVSTKTGFLYKGACVNFALDWTREYTRDLDIVPSSTISFQFTLRNMGSH